MGKSPWCVLVDSDFCCVAAIEIANGAIGCTFTNMSKLLVMQKLLPVSTRSLVSKFTLVVAEINCRVSVVCGVMFSEAVDEIDELSSVRGSIGIVLFAVTIPV